MIIEIIALPLVIITEGQLLKWPRRTSPRFVDVSEEKIHFMKENAIPRNNKHATKFEMTLFKGKMWKLCYSVNLNSCENFAYVDMHEQIKTTI